MFANSNGGSVGDGGGVDGKGINVEGGNSIFSRRSPSNSEEETPTISLSSIMSGDDTNQYDDHVQSPHASSFTRYEHVKEEYERHAMESVVEMVEERGGLRGRRLTSDAGEDVPSKVVSSFKIDLSSIEFKPSSEQMERVLQGGLPQEVDDEDSSAMITFGTKDKKKNKEKAAKQKAKRNKKKKLPKIDNLLPKKGQVISQQVSFSATISPAIATKAKIDGVEFQLTDPQGISSDWLAIPQISSSNKNSLYEITVDGFEKYAGTKWTYRIMASDVDGKKTTSSNVLFKVEGVGSGGKDFENGAPSGTPDKAPPAPSPNSSGSGNDIPQTLIKDSNWPYDGAIQSAVGRILFEFGGNGGTYVCSGTVVKDKTNGRTIILTAAHCAYNDALKKFATKAVFIPDQVSTKGDKSDFDCTNDRYGCWTLSFAVVSKGWASNAFPQNVQYDYAYYVVMDDKSNHSGGYGSGVSGTLDKDVVPMDLDFDVRPQNEFTVALGYSADRDPSFRYCTDDMSTIMGVPWYVNLWLDRCGMTGGASGGSWLIDMNQRGEGTVVSVNSWGFTDKPGMAGPDFRTSSGSFAECLFEKARSARDPGSVGGYIVDC
jgi:hypothetical protein